LKEEEVNLQRKWKRKIDLRERDLNKIDLRLRYTLGKADLFKDGRGFEQHAI
jgi:hypothetical protein